jgi:tRNA pseudouridine38-40 synthase
MPRYFLELAYKGTAYSGFQVQENAPTVQAAVESALQTLFRQSFELTGSSRTDTGVHALQNYFHFDTELVIEDRLVYNLNALLPADITVKGIFEVPADAHCRFAAIGREYSYTIYRHKNPFWMTAAGNIPIRWIWHCLQQAAN